MNTRRWQSLGIKTGRRELLTLAGLFLLALLTRLYRLEAAPPGLNGDEVYNLIDALAVGANNVPVYMPGNLGREALYFYLLNLSLRLLGITIFALRLPSVLLGSGTVIFAYLIGRDTFGRRAGFVAAALIAISLWPVMLSRIGLRAISLTFMSTVVVYLLYRALETGNGRTWLLAGLALGLTMYTYIPARVFPPVIGIWLLWVYWRRREQIQANRRRLLLSLLLAVLVFAPLGVYMLRNPDIVNQRIVSMTSALERARAGEPKALLASVGGVLKMFSIEGDEEWRYHLAHRPVFDPVTSVFFYLGVGLSILEAFRKQAPERRQPEYALLLLWMGAMLAPNAVLNENPSFIRAAGAITPIFLITGVGVDAFYVWMRARVPAARMLGPALLGLALALTLAITAYSYFIVWSNNEEVRTVYHADQALMGRYLEEHAPPPGARVFVAYNYVYDRPTALSLALFTDVPVAWFARENTFVWPDDERSSSQPVWYMVPVNHKLPSDVVEQLAMRGVRETIRYANGDEAFVLYRMDRDASAFAPDEEVGLSFAGGPRLVGYDVADTTYGGETVRIRLYWEIPANRVGLANRLTFVQIHLGDATGAVRVRAEALLGYPQAGWQSGDRFMQDLTLEIPTGMLPGPASLAIGLRDDSGQLLDEMQSVSGDGQIVVRSRPVQNFEVTENMAVYDETLVLTDTSFRPVVTPGAALNLELNWVALRRPSQDYRVRLELVDGDSDEPILSQTFALWPKLYPPTRWQVREAVTTLHGLQTPAGLTFDDEATLHVYLLPARQRGDEALPVTSGSTRIGVVALDERPHRFEPLPVANRSNAQFGDNIRLLGYEIRAEQAYPGGAMYLTLVWQATETPQDNYTVFNHVRGLDGQLKGQFDSPPVGEAWLTETWLPGEVIVEQRVIPIDPEASAGPAELIIGLYTVEDLERLPVTTDGRKAETDQLVLTQVEILPAPTSGQ